MTKARKMKAQSTDSMNMEDVSMSMKGKPNTSHSDFPEGLQESGNDTHWEFQPVREDVRNDD